MRFTLRDLFDTIDKQEIAICLCDDMDTKYETAEDCMAARPQDLDRYVCYIQPTKLFIHKGYEPDGMYIDLMAEKRK